MTEMESTVISVPSKKYESKRVICRENGLMLYGPISEVSESRLEYDIVLPQPVSVSTNTAFSLFRTNDRMLGENVFNALKDAIPYFANLSKKLSTSTLQEVSDLMRKNESWTLAHLVVHMDKITLLEDPMVLSCINEVDNETRITPIMLAINNRNFNMVKALISLGASLNFLSDGNSVVHLAAAKDKNILKYLLTFEDGRQWMNNYNDFGLTPLHYACQSENEECLQILIDAGATAINESGMSHYSSPLHVCVSKTVIEKLIDFGFNVNDLNEFNETPLHVMVKNLNYDCVMTLLSNNANPNTCDKNGCTPLHDAVKLGDLKITKALVVFGANLNHVNNKGQTPRHLLDLRKPNSAKLLYTLHAIGASRCQAGVENCDDSCSYDGSNNGAYPVTDNDYPDPNPLESILTVLGMEKAALEKRKISGGRLLCLDGGGIRGLILIQILDTFQQLAGKPIIQCFDWVSGTSIGGILALALANNKSLSECRSLFFQFKDTVFKGNKPYPSEHLEKLLKKNLTEDMLFSSIQHPKLIITGVKVEKYPLSLHLFRNYPSPADILKYGENASQYIPRERAWELARCTSAAPTFFNPFKDYLDGGLIANNPTLDSLTEILEYGLARRAAGLTDTVDFATIVLSCGTGVIPNTNIEKSIFTSDWGNTGIFGKLSFITSYIKVIAQVVIELIAGSDGRLIDRARAWCSTAGVPYYRFSPRLSRNVPLDETSNEILVDVLWETREYMHKNIVLAKEVVDCLLRE